MGDESNRTRRRALQTIGSAVVAGLAGCTSLGVSSDGQQSTDTESPTSTGTESSTSTDTETSGHDHGNHTHENTTDKPAESVQFAQNPKEVHSTLVEKTSVPSDKVLLGYRLEDSSLPFTTEVYQAPDDAEVQATNVYNTQDLSKVDLVPDQPQALDTVDTEKEDVHYGTTDIGKPLKVTLVARHDGKSLEWSSWDRTGYPHDGHDEENPALKVDCYCNGPIYAVPENGTWARVIQVTPTERVDTGTAVVVNWTASRTASQS